MNEDHNNVNDNDKSDENSVNSNDNDDDINSHDDDNDNKCAANKCMEELKLGKKGKRYIYSFSFNAICLNGIVHSRANIDCCLSNSCLDRK